MQKHCTILSREEGKVDVLLSIGLFVSSAILLFQGSLALSSALHKSQLVLPVSIGESAFEIVTSDGEQIGNITLFTEQTSRIHIEGRGELQLSDKRVDLYSIADINLLGQVQSVLLSIRDREERVDLRIDGIFPLTSKTELLKGTSPHIVGSSYPETLECTYETMVRTTTGFFACKDHELLRELQALLQKLSVQLVSVKQIRSVALLPASVTFKQLQSELLSLHLGEKEHD